MNLRPGPDSAQIIAALGATSGFVVANYDRLIASFCALIGIAYTLWKWRQEARKVAAETAAHFRK